jgi:carbamate kinase
MQIHEILTEQRLDELPAALGKLAQGAKNVAAGVQGAAAGFQQSQQQRAFTGQQSALAKAAYDQWNRKVMALSNAAGGQPVDPNDYKNHLADFVEKTILNNRKIQDLDAASQTRINTAMGEIIKNQADRAGLQKSFQNLITQSAVSREDPAKASQAPNLQQLLQRMQSGAPMRKTNNPAVDQLLTALGVPLQP